MARTEIETKRLRKTINLSLDQIEAFKAEDKYTFACMSSGEEILLVDTVANTIKVLFAEFGPKGDGTFIRTCRGSLVKLSAVCDLYPKDVGSRTGLAVKTAAGFEFVCSRRETPSFRKEYEKYRRAYNG